MVDVVVQTVYQVADFECIVARAREYRPYWPPYHLPSGRPGLFWTDELKCGIGYILVDYNLRYNLCVSTETGTEAPLAQRVASQGRAVLAGVAEFEEEERQRQ